ncbi:hypothetical protein RclHR1_04850002 [Rhizophagus clarus]|uniref:Uncharacterized protein n=1 Tax=Rhizophagus clarus TaxID=94130 RepID=A0A2Z6RKJ2_9GLOM|nr:hypothetical protein RclHR1_04850002 [Rhizophagus clarus]
MWCSRIRDPFRKILKENLAILSGNGYITMYGKHYSFCDTVYSLPSNYIYCNMCNSLVFIPKKYSTLDDSYQDSHLKSCINGDAISKEYARRNDILESIDTREFLIWQYK